MKKGAPIAGPDAYVAALSGWQRELVTQLRSAVRAAGPLDEVIKWGHLVYISQGPALLIRAEEARVLLGFWRGQRLLELEPRLTPGGKYEMATVILGEGDVIGAEPLTRLVRAAVALNQSLGDPTKQAR